MTAAERAAQRIWRYQLEAKGDGGTGDSIQHMAAIIQQECGEGEWVSVDSGVMPELGATVLVWKERREGYDIVEWSKKAEEHRLYTRKDLQWWDNGDRITHWRPLPAPPQAAQPSAGAQPSERSE